MQRTHRVTRQLLKTASISRPTFLVATCHLISSSSSPLVSPRSISTSRPLSYPLKSTQTSHTSCPTCSTPLPSPLVSPSCSNCSSLLPPSPSPPTAFQLFSIPPQYSIDPKELKKSFLKLQQAVHPDRFGGEGDLKEEWAKTWSSRVNDAYKLLLNPLERGEYLLELNRVIIGESDPVTDPELLMEIMEVREALEEATTTEQVEALRQTNSRATEEAIESLREKLDGTEKDFEGARNLVIQLKYLGNVEQVCREWSPGKRLEIQH